MKIGKFDDANCRDCGALVEMKNHDVCTPAHGLIASIQIAGQDAIKETIANMPDKELTASVSVYCGHYGDRQSVDRYLVTELTRRYRALKED